MNNDWQETTIGDLCDGIFDGPHATPQKTTQGPVFLGISSLSSGRIDLSLSEHLSEEDYRHWTRRVTPLPGDVVFSYETRLGEAAIIPAGLRCCLGRRMALMRPNRKKVDPRFLLYAYLGPYFQGILRAKTVPGSTVDRISLLEFPRFPVLVPPISEQRAIAHILGTLDDKIELNRKMNETLDEIARVLFTSWFVNFDPVRAKSEGRQPEGMDAETTALFPDRFVDSELGPIPEGWNWSTIGDEVSIVGGGTPSTKVPEFWDGGEHWWTTPKDLSGLQAPILTRTARKVTDLGLQRISSGLLPKNSVLLSSRAPIGYVALPSQPTAINQGFIGMVCDKNLGTPFVLNWTRENMEQIKSRANGSTFQEISKTNFRTMPLLIPDLQITKFYEQIAGSLYALIEKNLHEAGTLAELRDTLLPRLLSGELRVPEVEDMLAPVAAQSVEARG